MIQFLSTYGEVIIAMTSIFIILLLPYGRIFKEANFNSQESFMEGYIEAEKLIKKGKNPTSLFNQCPGAEDSWDRGWVQACSDNKSN